MRYVELIPGVRSSVLGFGCAPVLGAVDASTARQAVHTALDAGITHFDLARSYGFGEAEKFIGRELRGMRDNVVLVTKFGIQATTTAALLRPFKPLIRQLRPRRIAAAAESTKHGLATKSGRLGGLLHERLPMTAKTMRHSLEMSLRALGTDRVDFYLMHEPEELSRWDELAACAQELKHAGKIRGWGLASPSEASLPMEIDLWQTTAPLAPSEYIYLQAKAPNKGLVLFSPLRGAAHDKIPERLYSLFGGFPNAIVLCSMFNSEHIRANANLIR